MKKVIYIIAILSTTLFSCQKEDVSPISNDEYGSTKASTFTSTPSTPIGGDITDPNNDPDVSRNKKIKN